MDFPQRLAALRKERSLTQDALAERVGVHVRRVLEGLLLAHDVNRWAA